MPIRLTHEVFHDIEHRSYGAPIGPLEIYLDSPSNEVHRRRVFMLAIEVGDEGQAE